MSSDSRNEKAPSFSLTSTNSVFSTRSNDIFAGLEALEQKHAAYKKNQESSASLEKAGVIKHDPEEELEDRERREGRQSSSNVRHRDSFPYRQRSNRNRTQGSWKLDQRDRKFSRDNFRRPGQLPPRPKRVPDYREHPEKWTSYSLEDVSEKDLSEKSNTRAALDFLWERKNDRERQERLAVGLPAEEERFESDTAACSKGLISFSRKKSKEKKVDSDDKSCSSLVGLNTLEESFSDQDGDDKTAGVESVKSSSLVKKSPFSESKVQDLSKFDSDVGGDGEQKDNEPAPTFKSRKNVRKQFRRRNDDDEAEDNDG